MNKSQPSEDNSAIALDSLLLSLAALIGIGVCFTLVGLLPAGILLFGLFLSLRSGDIFGVRKTTRLIQGLGILAALTCAGFSGYAHIRAADLISIAPANPDTDPSFKEAASTNTLDLILEGKDAFGMKSEYFEALTEYQNFESDLLEINDQRNGLAFAGFLNIIFTVFLSFLWLRPLNRQLSNIRKIGSSGDTRVPSPSSTISRETHAPISMADELRKWTALREEGLINEKEFAEARERLFNPR